MMMSIQSRSLGGNPGKSNAYSPREQYIQQVIALTSSSISMLSGLISFYWFATMHRNFRHQYVAWIEPLEVKEITFCSLTTPRLIMLLIASGMFKALWYWIPPIAILASHEPITHGLCQTAGFLLAVGIEASGLWQRVHDKITS